jgi:hypothetical protein
VCTLGSDQDLLQEGWNDQRGLSACPGCGRQTSLPRECCRSCGYQLPEGAGQRTSRGDRVLLVLLALGFTATLTFYPTHIQPLLTSWRQARHDFTPYLPITVSSTVGAVLSIWIWARSR